MEFTDLKFEQRIINPKTPFEEKMGIMAIHEFENGCKVSVVASDFAYCHPRKSLTESEEYDSFEVAFISPSGCFATSSIANIKEDILGWADRERITELLTIAEQYSFTEETDNELRKEDLDYLRTSINTIDSLAIEMSEMITDNDKEDEDGYDELRDAMDAMAEAVTNFQSFKGWI